MERLHTKQVAYGILSIIALATSMFFAARAAIVYNTFFYTFSGDAVISIAFSIIAFIVITGFSFFISTHWDKKNKLYWIIAIIVTVHDVGGMVYIMYAHQSYDWHDAQVIVTQIVITLAVCLVSSCPVFLGLVLEQLKPQLQPEREILFTTWVDNYDMLLQQKAAKLYGQLSTNPEVLIEHAPDKLRQVLESKGLTLIVRTEQGKFLWVIPKNTLKASVEKASSPIEVPQLPHPDTETGQEMRPLKDILEEPVKVIEEGDVALNFPMRAGGTVEVQATPPAKHYLNQTNPYSAQATVERATENTMRIEKTKPTARQMAESIRTRKPPK